MDRDALVRAQRQTASQQVPALEALHPQRAQAAGAEVVGRVRTSFGLVAKTGAQFVQHDSLVRVRLDAWSNETRNRSCAQAAGEWTAETSCPSLFRSSSRSP